MLGTTTANYPVLDPSRPQHPGIYSLEVRAHVVFFLERKIGDPDKARFVVLSIWGWRFSHALQLRKVRRRFISDL